MTVCKFAAVRKFFAPHYVRAGNILVLRLVLACFFIVCKRLPVLRIFAFRVELGRTVKTVVTDRPDRMPFLVILCLLDALARRVFFALDRFPSYS